MDYFSKYLTETIEGQKITMVPFREESLYGTIVSIGERKVILCNLINSLQRRKAFYKIITKLKADSAHLRKRPLRGAVYQIYKSEEDWAKILNENYQILALRHQYGLSAQILHLAIEAWQPRKDRDFYQKNWEKMVQLQNIDAWEIYCYWMGEEIEFCEELLKLEQAEAYTLEACLKEYLIELRGLLLRNEEAKKEEKLLKIGEALEENELSLERDVVRARTGGSDTLLILKQILEKIEKSIEFLNHPHPQLKRLRTGCRLLSALLENFFNPVDLNRKQQVNLLQRFHHELEVISVLSGEDWEAMGQILIIQAAACLTEELTSDRFRQIREMLGTLLEIRQDSPGVSG